jgi:diguanylate cyclase (GGDEF)-like protein/PAS domain S-box-containing protein
MTQSPDINPELSRQFVDTAPDGVLAYELIRDRKGRAAAFKLRMCNVAAQRMLDTPDVQSILDRMLPDRPTEDLFRQYTDVAYSGRGFSFDKVLEDANGVVKIAISISVRPMATGIALTLTEETERTRELREWKRRSERLELLARRANDVVSLHTPDGFTVWASDSALRVLGVDPKALLGSHITERLHPDDIEPLASGARLPVGQTLRLRAGDTGEERWLELKFEGHGRHVLVMTRDITALRALELRAAAADPSGLAGVKSRDIFLDELEKEISRRRRYGRPVSVVAIAIDQHKAIAAQRGDIGVRATQEVLADVARQVTRNVDMIGQWSDEVFLLLLPETPAVGAVRASERLSEKLAERQVEGAGKPFRVTLGAGVTAVDASDTAKTVLARAGRHLAAARKLGGGRIHQDADRKVA